VWKRFCNVIGQPGLINDLEFLTNRDRVKNVERLEGIVAEWTAKRKVDDIVALLMAASVPCAPILNVDQICNDPHIAKAREMIAEMDHPLGGRMNIVSCPIKFTNMKPTVRSTAPLHGEHTELILTDFLGISQEEYLRLKSIGVTG
ncbi:MAG: CoA transferase, partial [Syntrophales bacterium]|nr:CoA transferase [Syntrophales bacterium]